MSGGGAIGRSHGSEGKAQSKGEGRGQSIGQGKSQSSPPWRVEETCTSGGGTRKRGDRREVEKGGRDPSLEGALVGAGTRSPGGVHKGLILPPGVQGSGGNHWAGSSGGRDGPPATAAWDHPRGTSQTAQLWTPTGVQASSVPSRLQPGGGVGFPHPCPADAARAGGGSRGRMGYQPSEGATCRGDRRFGGAPREATEARSRGRETCCGEEREIKEDKKKRKEGEKGEEREEEKARFGRGEQRVIGGGGSRREPCPPGSQEIPDSPFCGDWPRSQGEDQAPGIPEGTTRSQEARKEELRQQLRRKQRVDRGYGARSRRRRSFSAGVEGETGGSVPTGSPSCSGFDAHERTSPLRDWPQRPTRPLEGVCSSLLQTVPSTPEHWPSSKRAPDNLLGGGRSHEWERGRMPGHPATKVEVSGKHFVGNALVGQPTTGNLAPRPGKFDPSPRDVKCKKGRLRGVSSEVAREPAGRSHWRGRIEGKWQDQIRQQGWSQRRRSRSQIRQRDPFEGRGEQEREGGRRPESLREGLQKETRVDTLDTTMKDQATPASGAYEEGSALALCPGSYPLPDPAALADAMVAADEAWQSLHAAASKLGVENLNAKSRDDGACAAAADGIALELTADAFSSEVKKDADDFPKGKFLGDCGDFLCARLLEVLSLRSQPMGKGDKKAIFPLPTSRSELGKVFPTVCERDLSWLLCVVRSLNSMWGGCLESHQPVKDCQKECLIFFSMM